jgi:hypothetical protein
MIVGLVVCAAMGAHAEDIMGRSLHFNDRWVYEWRNTTPSTNAKVTFNVSFDYRCRDQYATWQHFQPPTQVIYVNANSVNNYVIYTCNSANGFDVQNENVQLISAVATN